MAFKEMMDNLLAYDTVKVVRIRDWRVGTVHYLFVVVIFAYVIIYETLWMEGYKLTTTPEGYVRLETDWPSHSTPAPKLKYCLPAGEIPGSKFQGVTRWPCMFIEDLEAVDPRGQGWLTVSTCITVYNETRRGSWLESHTKQDWIEQNTTTYFVADVERMPIWIDHAVIAPTMGIYGNSLGMKGALVSSTGRQVKKFTDAKTVVTVGDLLAAVDRKDLDIPSGAVLKTGLSRREAGLVLLVSIVYTNIKTGGALEYTLHPRLVDGLHFKIETPIYVAYPDHRVRWKRHGIRVIFLPSGTVGKFDFKTFLLSLVAGVVLLGSATVMVDILSTRILPQRKAYYDCKYEEVTVLYEHDDDGLFGHVDRVDITGGVQHYNEDEGSDTDKLKPNDDTNVKVQKATGTKAIRGEDHEHEENPIAKARGVAEQDTSGIVGSYEGTK